MESFVFICRVFLWLMIYSCLGWVYESTLCSITERKLVNRGFLNGPLCPVYGFGALLIIFVFWGRSVGPIELFLSAAVLTTALEYLTSYLLEKLFHARWWDYSHYRFQLNGRVCLAGFLAFGAFSVVLENWLHPLIGGLTNKLSDGWTIALALILLAVLLVDLAVTVSSILKLNTKLAEIQAALDGFHTETVKRAALLKEDIGTKLNDQKEKLDELKGRLIERFEDSTFYTERLKGLLNRPKRQHKRLLKAFPRFDSLRYGEALAKLRETVRNKKKP